MLAASSTRWSSHGQVPSEERGGSAKPGSKSYLQDMRRVALLLYIFAAVVVAGYLVLLALQPNSCPGDWNDNGDSITGSCERWAAWAFPFFYGSLFLVPVTAVVALAHSLLAIRHRRTNTTLL